MTLINPPQAKKIPVSHTIHGVTREDNYGWLRDDNWQNGLDKMDSAVLKHLESENAYTAAMMSDTENLQKTLFEEMKGRIEKENNSLIVPDGKYAYYTRFEEGDEYVRFMRCLRNGGEDVCLLNGNELSIGYDYFNLEAVGHSASHNYIYWYVDTVGSEKYVLKLKDLKTGKILHNIEDVCGHVLLLDESYLFYIKIDDNFRATKIFRRKFEDFDGEDDVLVYHEKDPAFSADVSMSHSGEFLYYSSFSLDTNEIHLLRADDVQAEPQLIRKREKNVKYFFSHQEDRFLIRTNLHSAVDYKIMETSVDKLEDKYWVDLIPAKKGCQILSILAFKNWFVRLERENCLDRVIFQNKEIGEDEIIAFDEESYELDVYKGFEYKSDNFWFHYCSFTTPSQSFKYDFNTGERTLVREQKIPSGHNPKNYIVKRLMVPTDDEEIKIPVTLFYHKDTKLDHTTPCYQHGYGAYGYTQYTFFDSNIISLINRGIVFAVTHVRGGEDLGFDWYKYGRLKHKWNTFKDFIRVTEWLNDENLVDGNNIVAHGGSAGGMLMGVIANKFPAFYKGIVAEVPFVDVLNTMLDDTLPLTPNEYTEWGNPTEDKEDFDLIHSYSPYDNITPSKFPNILATAGINDKRVIYWEPAKWVAKLRENNLGSGTILLNTQMKSGHFGTTGRFDYLKEIAFIYAFILKTFGLLQNDSLSDKITKTT